MPINEDRGRYEGHTRDQMLRLLEKRDRERKLGLVWERDELEADHALEGEFVAATPVAELHEGLAPWKNLVIEGDNFDALRWLRMTWANRIKCIYVDPPYNTGNKDWVYNDNYFKKEDRYRHSTWLEFLYRRFLLARDLLAEDGVILVSINDENRAKLEMLLEEVMPGMRVGSFVWRTKDTANDAEHNFSSVHEHVLAYGKPGFEFRGHEISPKKYRNPDKDRRGIYSTDPITQPKTRLDRANGYYPILDDKTGWWYPCNPDSVWRYVSGSDDQPRQNTREPSIEELKADNRLVFTAKSFVEFESLDQLKAAIIAKTAPKDGNGQQLFRLDLPDLEFWVQKKIGLGRPYRKSFWNEKDTVRKPVSSWILSGSDNPSLELVSLESEKQGAATREIAAIFGEKSFNFPKPSSLLKSLLAATCEPGSVVLDFFAGSATAAQAVMALNAEDAGGRRFIMASSTEATQDEPNKNVCRDITSERIRRINASLDPDYESLNADFAYLRCRKLRFEDLDYEEGLIPSETWAAIESLHQLPLTPYTPAPWTAHETDAVAVVYVDRFASDIMPWLKARSEIRKPTFVYSWAPGQIRDRLDGAEVELRSIHDTLVARFRQ